MLIQLISFIFAIIVMIILEKKGYINKLENKIIDFLIKKDIVEIELKTFRKVKIKRNKK